MNILIAFGTTEGQTRKIARYMARSIQNAGHDAELYDCSDTSAAVNIADFDAVILAASVHHKRYQSEIYGFVEANLKALQAMHSAFVSVSLSMTLASGEEEARSYVDDFVSETGLRPNTVHLAEGAIRFYQYGSSEAATIELIVFKGQKKLPERTGNPEYTDWQALDDFAASFIEGEAEPSSAGPG